MTNSFISTENLLSHDKIFPRNKTFFITKFFLLTIFPPFRDHFVNHPCCEYVNMADNKQNVEMNQENENDLIKGYYFQGFEYRDILLFLYQYHGISISKRTLQCRMKSYDVSRRHAKCNIDTVVNEKRALLVGPKCMGGYRFVRQRLKMKGLQVPCNVVQLLLSQFDPEGCYMRKYHRLRKRVYRTKDPMLHG